MTAPVPVRTNLIWDNAGHPRLVALLAPRCSLASCNHILKGDIVTYGDEMFHARCWAAVKTERMPKPDGPTPGKRY